MSRPLFPVEDLSYIPDDWLEAFLLVTAEDGGDPDSRFASEIQAIFRMRDIQAREGRCLVVHPKAARAEKLRREGRPVPVERDQLYERDGGTYEVGRVSVKAGWAELRTDGAPHAKRHPLPLHADFRLIGWAH
ncbi:MAG TPA: hypothetical protein VGG75_40140 [Trebonia sp.]